VAWRRLVSLHVGSPPGSQNSLAPLNLENPATWLCRHSGSADSGKQRWLWQTTGRDEAGLDPGSFGQYPQTARTGDDHVITADDQAHHAGFDGIAAATAGQQYSCPATMGRQNRLTRFADQPPSGIGAGA
jgi:hypothetical protein